MTDLPASAFDSADCRYPGCPWEARYADGMCSDHHGRPLPPPGAVTATTDSRGRLIPGALAHLMRDDETDPKETHVETCKIDGCNNPSAGKGGSWHGLCLAHVSEEGRRRQAAGRAAKIAVKPPPVQGTAQGTPAPPKSPDPAPAPALSAPENGTPNPAARLAELLPLIAAKREEILELQAEAVGLLTDINELIEAA